MATSSQKFIARNRAPRVQIEYDVELYGAEKKIQLPFVMGVMSDLSGKPTEALPPVADRKPSSKIDVDNFDARMKSMKPRVAFQVPNTLTGEGNIAVDITFESMDDFSPAAVAQQGRRPEAIARSPPAARQPRHLHGRQDRRRGIDRQGDQGRSAAEVPRGDAKQAVRRGRRPDRIHRPTTPEKPSWRESHPLPINRRCRESNSRAANSPSLLEQGGSSRSRKTRAPRSKQAVQTLAQAGAVVRPTSSAATCVMHDRGDDRRARQEAVAGGQR